MRRLTRHEMVEEQNQDISPINLIDVLFVLLIFLMVSSTFEKDLQVDIERPGAQSGAAASGESLRVFVDRAGQIYVDELPVRPWMLQSRVRDALDDAADTTVLVVTDERVPAELLIEVVDQCRLAGAKDVGVATELEAG